MTTNKYKSQVTLGQRYRDTATGFEGKCVAISFFEHGCERLTLKGMNGQNEIVEYAFDAPEVELITEGKPQPIRAVEAKTGGPHDLTPMRRR
jgi:hypothetical protein